MLQSYGIKGKATTVKNPRANGLIERIHLTQADMLRTRVFEGHNWQHEFRRALGAITWALTSTVPTQTSHSPGELAFGRDMIFATRTKIDWRLIKREKKKAHKNNTARENKRRVAHKYKVGDLVLIVKDSYERSKLPKLQSPTEGPYKILRTNRTNGTVQINRKGFKETINIRRLQPYHKK